MRTHIKNSIIWKRFKCLVDGHSTVRWTKTVTSPSIIDAGGVFDMHPKDKLTFTALTNGSGIPAILLEHMQCLVCNHVSRVE